MLNRQSAVPAIQYRNNIRKGPLFVDKPKTYVRTINPGDFAMIFTKKLYTQTDVACISDLEAA